MASPIINKIRFFKYLLSHPLNRHHKIYALKRYFCWQIGGRLVCGTTVIPFINDTRLFARPGMVAATLNIYTGLHEFEDMSFVLHCLDKQDTFVDIGANIGSYTVIASAVIGAKCISIEPIPSTFSILLDNIHLNKAADKVTALNIGVGKETDFLRFTENGDTMNRVVFDTNDQNGNTVNVPVKKLDDILAGSDSVFLKIDVEGFETNVIKGADKLLSGTAVMGIIIELNGGGNYYGFNELQLHEQILHYGFKPFCYSPFDRKLIPLKSKNYLSGNTIYIRDEELIQERIANSSSYHIHHVNLDI